MLVVPTNWLAKLKPVGERLIPGDVAVPVRATVCGLPAALSVIESVPFTVPAVVGAKLTLIAQELAAARDEPQLFAWEKPVETAIPVIVSAAVPVFVSVIACDCPVVPID